MGDVLKSKTVATVTSNEEEVRLRIYEGVIPLDEAGELMIRLYREQAHHEALRHDETRKQLYAVRKELRELRGAMVDHG